MARPASAKKTRKKAPPASPKRAPTPPVARALTPRERERCRAVLLGMRENVSGHLASLKNGALERTDTVNLEEDGSEEFEREFSLQLAASRNASLHEIDDALERIEAGTYGVCEQCYGYIEKPRIEALPVARTCVACQSRLEQTNGRRRVLPPGM